MNEHSSEMHSTAKKIFLENGKMAALVDRDDVTPNSRQQPAYCQVTEDNVSVPENMDVDFHKAHYKIFKFLGL